VALGAKDGQGVIIPKANVKHLSLKDEVRNAVDEGTFSLWAIETVDEGLEILTGESPGEADESGRYPEDSVNGKAQARLESYEKTLHEISGAFRSSEPGAGAPDAAQSV
jgi:predicted ATP-dependent protease